MEWGFTKSVFSEYNPDGFLGVAIQLPGGVNATGRTLEVVHPLGWIARPKDPDASRGAGCLYFWHGSEGFSFPTTDPRQVGNFPQVKPGGSCAYSEYSFLYFDGEDGSTMLYIPTQQGEGPAHVLAFNNDVEGEENVQLRHANGAAVVMTKDKVVIHNHAGDAYIELGSEGIVLNGNVKINGAIVGGDVASAEPLVKFVTFAAWYAEVNSKLGTLSGTPPATVVLPTVALSGT